MGRIPVPTEILDAKGSFLKHPERHRPNEPQETRPLGNAPKYLTDEQKKLWGEIAHNLPPGVGKISDRFAFEMLVRLMAKERADAINNNQRGQLIKLLGSFDNSGVSAAWLQPPEEGFWADSPLHGAKPEIQVFSAYFKFWTR
jgi:hypothetical protein